jgi:hypothetical protein
MMVSLHLTFISHFALGELGAESLKACLESHILSNRHSRHVTRLSGGSWLLKKKPARNLANKFDSVPNSRETKSAT